MFGLFGTKKEKKDENEKDLVKTTVAGGVVPKTNSALPLPDDTLKHIIESAAVGQPQLAEHVTGQINNYITDIVPEPFKRIFASVLAPAVLLGDASNKEIADIMIELYANRLRYAHGPRGISGDLVLDYDILYSAAQPILRLAKKSHLLHVTLRYGPIIIDEED